MALAPLCTSLLLLTGPSWDLGLLLVLSTVAALVNAVVTSCIDSFSSPCPLLLLGLLQEIHKKASFSHTNNMTYRVDMFCA